MIANTVKRCWYLLMLSCLLVVLPAGSAMADCDPGCFLDWNEDGEITESDYLVGEPIGGFYAEWYIYLYYPVYYPILFPGHPSDKLDINCDGVIDEADLMGFLDPVNPTEGFYVAWYIYSFYPAYYPVFLADMECPPKGVQWSPDTLVGPRYEYVDNEWFDKVSRDGTLIGGSDRATTLGFVVETQDLLDAPGSKAAYEYLGAAVIRNIVDFSGDKRIVLANVRYDFEGSTVNDIAYYNRDTQTWTNLGYPEGDYGVATCSLQQGAGGISEDGNLIVGHTILSDAVCRFRPFVYDIAAGTWTIAVRPDGVRSEGLVFDVDRKAETLVGWSYDGEASRTAAKWVKNPAGDYVVELLDDPDGGEVRGISYNGDYIVGHLSWDPTIWYSDGSSSLAGDGLTTGQLMAISDDGRVAVGNHPSMGAYTNVSIMYPDAGVSMYGSYTDFLAAQGAPVGAEWNASAIPLSISSDGKVIVGLAGSPVIPKFGFVSVISH